MPHSPRSQLLTKQYRQRLDAQRDRLQRLAVERWPTIEELDSTDWTKRMATAVEQAQVEALRTTAGYLSAFLTLEMGKRTQSYGIDSRSKAGFSTDGQPLGEGLRSPLIGVYVRLKKGSDASEALGFGLSRARRQVGMDFDAAHRLALLEAIDSDDRFAGWQRATNGTCGACLAVAAHVHHGLSFPVHPGCHCVSEPVVSGVPNSFPRPTGTELFAQKSESEKNEAVGPKAAALLAVGAIELSELVQYEELDSDMPDLITQRPVDQLLAQ